MVQFLLDNSIFIIAGLFLLYNLIAFKLEYFPSKARCYDNLMQVYVEYELYKRFERKTKTFLPNNKIWLAKRLF